MLTQQEYNEIGREFDEVNAALLKHFTDEDFKRMAEAVQLRGPAFVRGLDDAGCLDLLEQTFLELLDRKVIVSATPLDDAAQAALAKLRKAHRFDKAIDALESDPNLFTKADARRAEKAAASPEAQEARRDQEMVEFWSRCTSTEMNELFAKDPTARSRFERLAASGKIV